ncbi:hypothetical protein [Orenia marismortui]|nr:hypothetical protein [Orenia marismortui]
MKKLFILYLALVILALYTPSVFAETVKLDSQILEVYENELVKLASQEKFDNLFEVMQKLVKNALSTEEKIIKAEDINVMNFKYNSDSKIIIYYQLKQK